MPVIDPAKKEPKTHLIEYYAQRYPLNFDPDDKQHKANFEGISLLIKILAETKSPRVFRTSYIKRFVDYQWNSKYLKIYKALVYIYGFSFLLTGVASYLLN